MAEAAEKPKKKVYIPEIAKDQILALAAKIRPIMDFPNEGRRYVEHCDLFKESYTWFRKPMESAPTLPVLRDIITYHSWAYYGLFKPSVAEVLAQLPDDIREQVVAFEIVKQPETAADFAEDKEAFDACYHVATTRLYGQPTE